MASCNGEPPESSASYTFTVVVSRPVSIFLRVLTGFFLFQWFYQSIIPLP